MNSIRRFIGTSILGLAKFLDSYFYQIALSLAGLAVFNYFFVKNYDKVLFEAAKDGKIKEIKDALKNGADINAQFNLDCTPLIIACGAKQEEAVKVLVDTGKCKLDAVDSKGRSALLVASGVGATDIVKFLLKNKADVKTSDNNGSTPLIVASVGGHAEVVRCLLAFNGEPRWKNKQGINALTGAINAHSMEGGRLSVIKELLSYSFKKDLGITESRNALNGWTPLIRAAYKGYFDIVKMLSDYSADIHAKGKKGFTALIAASQNGHKNIVEFLLERGADPHCALDDGSTATIAASFGGYHEIVDMLVRADKNCMNCRFKNGSTPLMTAALNGYISVVKVLLAHGVDVNCVNDDNVSAFSVAAQKGCLKICALLIEAGADIELPTDRGYTPLMTAIKAGHDEVVKLLLKNGARVNHFTVNAVSGVLEYASIDEKAHSITSANSKNNHLSTNLPLLYGYIPPLMLAINRGSVDTVRLLLEHDADVYLDLAALMSHCDNPKDKYTDDIYETLKKEVREAEEREAALKKEVNQADMANRLKTSTALRDAQDVTEAAAKRLDVFIEEQESQQEALKDSTLVYTYFPTPLLFAVYWDAADIVKLLLDSANTRTKLLTQRNSDGLDALALAVDYFHTDLVLLLLQHGAEIALEWKIIKMCVRMIYRWKSVAAINILQYAFMGKKKVAYNLTHAGKKEN